MELTTTVPMPKLKMKTIVEIAGKQKNKRGKHAPGNTEDTTTFPPTVTGGSSIIY